MLLFNLGLLFDRPNWSSHLVTTLQFDRPAILHGEIWRVITGNLVHWSLEHFALDVAVFLVVGCLYEPIIRRIYPWLMLASAAAVGVGLLLFQPALTIYRGLSGVDSGQFAAAVGIECLLASREKRRWLWVGPATAVFALKILFECGTGQMFFGTESLGDIGRPVPLAHAAGVAAVLGFVAICLFVRNSAFREESAGEVGGEFEWCDFQVRSRRTVATFLAAHCPNFASALARRSRSDSSPGWATIRRSR
jgi:rhomboid family GlyGly-CTERM serine protease